MATVPYNPVPTAQPSDRGTPMLGVQANPAAFGGPVGAALQHLGGVEEHVGDEIFQRAKAIQELQNETDAKEADAQYMMKVGELHANFSALQGRQAVEAYPKYNAELQALRLQMRGDLPNDSARKMFDGNSLSTMGRTIFNGAGHAATQMKVAAHGASVARVDMFKQDAFQNPGDDIGFQRGVNGIKSEVQSQADISGWSEAQKADESIKQVSSAWAHRISGLAKTEPFKAEEMLKEHRLDLRPEDAERVENTVRTQTRNTGARVEALRINSDLNNPEEGKPERTLADRVTEAKEIGKKHNDPLLGQAIENQVIAGYQQNKKIIQDEDYRRVDLLTDAMRGNLSQGKSPANIDELKAVRPDVGAAYDALPAAKQIAFERTLNNYNASSRKAANDEQFDRLRGMASTTEGREELLNTDVTRLGLSRAQIDKLWTLQGQLRKNVDEDPRVNRAIGWMRTARGAELEALGIFRRTDSNKEDYDKFAGAMQQAIEVWTETNKKPPSQKDIVDTIGPQVIGQKSTPGWLWGTNKADPNFRQPVPADVAKLIRTAPEWLALPDEQKTDERLAAVYNRLQYKKLYESGIKKSQARVGE